MDMEEIKEPKGKEREEFVRHPELKGLLILALSLVVLAALVSFFHTQPEKNFLGLIGYFIAFALTWTFGLGSYLIVCFSCWIGWRLLYSEKVPAFTMRAVYFGIVLICCCLLFNVFSEVYGVQNPLLQSHVYSESIQFKTPFMMTITRYNLGGAPLYYLYRDLPIYNLKNLLSNIGVFFTFSLTGIISFILLTQLSLVKLFKNCVKSYSGISRFFKMFLRSFKPFPFKGEKRNIPYNEMEEALSRPARQESKPLWQEPSSADHFYASFSEEEEVEEKEIEIFEEPEEEVIEEKKEKKPYNLTPKKRARRSVKFKLPPSSLLTSAKKVDKPSLKRELRKQAEILEDTLSSFGIEAKVGQINCGPTITSFELHPAVGVKVQKIKALEDDIALNLQAKSIRIIAPIPGKAAVGVEVPSLYPQEVGFKEMLSRYQQQQRKKFAIPILLGKTVSGEDVMCDLTKMPHCIIAGATGSGKSVCINTIVMSILMNNKPDEVKLMLVDPKKVELSSYSELPHMIAPVITEPQGAYAALQWLVKEMQYRYEILKRLGLRNITSFNNRTPKADEADLDVEVPEKFFYVVAIIDEFADLMMASSTDLETPIARIAQMARAVGIHLILATQRPSREVITGLIKANFPTRIAFKVSSRINSQIILDENGAETLLGNGDLLFMPPGSSQLIRAQGAFIRDDDINKIIDFHCSQDRPNYLIKSFDQLAQDELFESESSPKDSLYDNALSIVLATRNASTTFLQRKLKIGYARAASLMDELEERGVIGPQEGSKPRKILANQTGFEDI